MNRCVYNYKYHVNKIVDGRTVDGILDMGFREYRERRFNLADVPLADVRRLRGPERVAADEEHAGALECLSVLLCPSDDKVKHGRTVVVSPCSPDRSGRSVVHMFVPIAATAPEYDEIICRNARVIGSNVHSFLHVNGYLNYMRTREFSKVVRNDLLSVVQPFDFAL